MASALVELSGFVPAAEGERYMAFAEKQIRTLASPEYTAPAGENGGFILRHSTGAYPFSSEVDVPLTYADYYYLEALTRTTRLHMTAVKNTRAPLCGLTLFAPGRRCPRQTTTNRRFRPTRCPTR